MDIMYLMLISTSISPEIKVFHLDFIHLVFFNFNPIHLLLSFIDKTQMQKWTHVGLIIIGVKRNHIPIIPLNTLEKHDESSLT